MDDALLQPWMLHADWRYDPRPWLLVDLAQWPADLNIEPRPPVPLVGLGPADHPQAGSVDLMMEAGFSLTNLARWIEQAPLASATVVQLLRATDGIPPDQALTTESFALAALQGGPEHQAWLRTRDAQKPVGAGVLHVARNGNCFDVVIDRPQALNAIDREMRDALFDAFALANIDESIRSLRLRSAGRAFCMGADLSEFGTTLVPIEAHMIRARTLPAWPVLRRTAIFDVHIQGGCVGSGLELAAFADRISASTRAWFQLPETAMGILPGFGGSVSLPRRIGRHRTALLMLSGKRINAALALKWGLIDAIVDDPAADQG